MSFKVKRTCFYSLHTLSSISIYGSWYGVWSGIEVEKLSTEYVVKLTNKTKLQLTCDLAVDGSPKSNTLISPLNFTPSGKVCISKGTIFKHWNQFNSISNKDQSIVYLSWASKQKAGNSLFHISMAKYWRSNLGAYILICIIIRCELFEFFNLIEVDWVNMILFF